MEDGLSQNVIWVLVGIIFPLFFLSGLAFYHVAQMFDGDLGHFGKFHIYVEDMRQGFGLEARRGWNGIQEILEAIGKIFDGILILLDEAVIRLGAHIQKPSAERLYLPIPTQEHDTGI